jgi:hypothetical protein
MEINLPAGQSLLQIGHSRAEYLKGNMSASLLRPEALSSPSRKTIQGKSKFFAAM